MQNHPAISDEVIQQSMVRSVENVFRTMMRREAKFVGRLEMPPVAMPDTAYVIGEVGFIGAANGAVHLCMTRDFVLFAATIIFGPHAADMDIGADDTLKDIVGEITNMTAGGFKNSLCDLGYTCRLTLPVMICGTSLSVEASKGAHRSIFQFHCAGHHFISDVQFKLQGHP